MKKIIYFLLLLFWLILIFILSNQNGEISGGNSTSILYILLEPIYSLFNIPKDNLGTLIEVIHEPVRECAHAFEYFVLGFLTFKNIENFKIKENKYIISILFCFICACFDETHQLFIDGRSFQYFDIFMDLIGCILILVILKIYNLRKRKINN